MRSLSYFLLTDIVTGKQVIIVTAFIGKGEGNSEKISIKISPSGGVLEIKRMTGDAMFNAEIKTSKS